MIVEELTLTRRAWRFVKATSEWIALFLVILIHPPRKVDGKWYW